MIKVWRATWRVTCVKRCCRKCTSVLAHFLRCLLTYVNCHVAPNFNHLYTCYNYLWVSSISLTCPACHNNRNENGYSCKQYLTFSASMIFVTRTGSRQCYSFLGWLVMWHRHCNQTTDELMLSVVWANKLTSGHLVIYISLCSPLIVTRTGSPWMLATSNQLFICCGAANTDKSCMLPAEAARHTYQGWQQALNHGRPLCKGSAMACWGATSLLHQSAVPKWRWLSHRLQRTVQTGGCDVVILFVNTCIICGRL